MSNLVNQTSAMPVRKVAAGGIAGAITVGLIAFVSALFPQFAPLVSDPTVASALTAAVSFITSYMTKARAE